jgi:hypothetical protein
MSITLLKGTDIINLSYKDRNGDLAKKCLVSISNYILKKQNEITQLKIRKKREQISKLKDKLEFNENFSKFLSTKIQNFDLSDSKLSALATLNVITVIKESEIMDLREQINNLEMALDEPQTKEASLIVPIYASDYEKRKISTKAISSAIGGVVLVIGFLILRRGRVKNSRGFV